MTTWREFLLENAKFPFPSTTRSNYTSSADINPLDIGSIPEKWKARYTVPDVTLVQKLCQTLDAILGDTPIEFSTNDMYKQIELEKDPVFFFQGVFRPYVGVNIYSDIGYYNLLY